MGRVKTLIDAKDPLIDARRGDWVFGIRYWGLGIRYWGLGMGMVRQRSGAGGGRAVPAGRGDEYRISGPGLIS